MTDDKSNSPKVLVEFEPDEISWLADRLHEEWGRAMQAVAVTSGWESYTDPEVREKARLAHEKAKAHQDMQNRLRNRLLDKSYEQGFGHL